MNTAGSTPYARWEDRTREPLFVLAVLFVGVISYPIINPKLTRIEADSLHILDIGIWGIFAIDYGVRLALAPNRLRFVRAHLPDLAVVLLPALRPLRLLRLLSLTRLVARRSRDALAVGVLKFVAAAAAVLVFVSAVSVLNFERPAKGSNITSFGDAVWWARTTVTTVGYGDRFPVTVAGRIIAVALMVTGVALVGVLTAGIAAWLVDLVSRDTQIEAVVRVEARELLAIADRLTAIEDHLRSHRRSAR